MTDHQTTPTPGVDSPDGTAVPSAGEAPTTAPLWYRRKRVAFPSAVLLVFLMIMITTGGNDPGFYRSAGNAVASKVRSITRSAPVAGTVGQSVRDGKLAFVVTSTEKPGKTITDRLGATHKAQGEFVIVRVSVSNIGFDARTLAATGQFLVSDKGQRYATSSAISGLRGAELVFRNEINPGSTVNEAPLLFDVPAGTTITGVELHDSLTSTGVRVTLG
jgi:hypothetical protein